MTKLTALFGQDAVAEYEKTGIIPPEGKEFPDGSQILQKEFATIQERDAYVEALEESDGADNWRVIPAEIPNATKLQFRKNDLDIWNDFPSAPTVDDFNNDFPAAFMHNYSSNNHIAWEGDMQKFIDDELSRAEFKTLGHDIPTKWQAEDEQKRLRQIIINETMGDFFSDLIAGKIEFRRIPQN